jgi:hypothetical protein
MVDVLKVSACLAVVLSVTFSNLGIQPYIIPDEEVETVDLTEAKPEPVHEGAEEEPEEFPVTYLSEKVPLDVNTQFCLNTWCDQYGVSYTLALAIIQAESGFNPNAVSKNGKCFSYMQINVCNEAWLKRDLGIGSVKNPLDNLRAGVYMIGGYIRKYEDLSMALMAYNCGEGGAKAKFNQGIYETSYTRKILGYKAEWDKELGKVDW